MELLIGYVLPPFIDAINRKVPNSRARFAFSVLISIAVAFAVKYSTLKYSTPVDLLESASLVFAESQIMYHTLYHDSPLEARINKV